VELIEVYAEVSCPFTYVGLHRFVQERSARGLAGPRLRVRAWPLELANGAPLTSATVAPAVQALRSSVAPHLFAGFDPGRFPATTLPVLAAESAAHRAGADAGERFSFAVRRLLFDEGTDVSDPDVIAQLLEASGVDPETVDPRSVRADFDAGRAVGVVGSPYFVVDGRGWFCPALDIHHEPGAFDVALADEKVREFCAAVFEAIASV
jgi:predicted DsbA family dithiol-disulfide isomerase